MTSYREDRPRQVIICAISQLVVPDLCEPDCSVRSVRSTSHNSFTCACAIDIVFDLPTYICHLVIMCLLFTIQARESGTNPSPDIESNSQPMLTSTVPSVSPASLSPTSSPQSRIDQGLFEAGKKTSCV